VLDRIAGGYDPQHAEDDNRPLWTVTVTYQVAAWTEEDAKIEVNDFPMSEAQYLSTHVEQQ